MRRRTTRSMRAWSVVVLAAVTGCGELRSEALAVDGGSAPPASERFPAGTRDASGAAPSTERLDPLEVGRTWTYDIASSYGACPSGVRTVKVLSEAPPAGDRRTFTVSGVCAGSSVRYTQQGDVLEAQDGSGVAMRLLDEPVEEGHAWTTTSGQSPVGMSYAAVPEITTRAGTFTDCWRVTQAVAYRESWTWCRGVGLVVFDFFQNGDGMLHYELVAKSF